MRCTICFAVSISVASLLAGCSGHGGDSVMSHGAPRAVTAATPAQQTALLERIKSLAGTWESADETGKTHTSSVFSVSSNGSAVREILMPGTPHEMTDMYTMDGGTLTMTHYCAMGNQPHLRSVSSAPDRIVLSFDGVSNMTAPDQLYMGELTIVFKDANHIREEWRSFKSGKVADHASVFEMTRKM